LEGGVSEWLGSLAWHFSYRHKYTAQVTWKQTLRDILKGTVA